MPVRISKAKCVLDSAGVTVTFGLHDADYRTKEDRINMPSRSAFETDEGMISTQGHELVHATGHSTRLARDTLRDYHKERAIRAREELIAEIGASFLMADRSEEHTSELQSLMRISYAVFCLKKKNKSQLHLTKYYYYS